METLGETVGLARFALSFIFVIALILLIGLVAKRSGWERRLLGHGKAGARLAVEETLAIDPRTRLVLVRRDNVRHLILLGQSHATLVESNIPSATESHTSHPATMGVNTL